VINDINTVIIEKGYVGAWYLRYCCNNFSLSWRI